MESKENKNELKSYKGATFGIIKSNNNNTNNNKIPTNPLNPWYLSSGIPNFSPYSTSISHNNISNNNNNNNNNNINNKESLVKKRLLQSSEEEEIEKKLLKTEKRGNKELNKQEDNHNESINIPNILAAVQEERMKNKNFEDLLFKALTSPTSRTIPSITTNSTITTSLTSSTPSTSSPSKINTEKNKE